MDDDGGEEEYDREQAKLGDESYQLRDEMYTAEEELEESRYDTDQFHVTARQDFKSKVQFSIKNAALTAVPRAALFATPTWRTVRGCGGLVQMERARHRADAN
eukprot:gene17531-52195_t